MRIAGLLESVSYVTDPQGRQTGVLVDLDVWQDVIQFLAQHTTELQSTHETGSDAQREVAFLREEAAFRRLHPSLRQQYRGKYVAIYNERLVDFDSDQVALYRRMRKEHPGKFVWIAPVNEYPDEVLRFRSPRLLDSPL